MKIDGPYWLKNTCTSSNIPYIKRVRNLCYHPA